MTIQLILIIIGLAIVFFLAMKLLKGLIKAAITVIIIIIILIATTGIIIYNDAMTIKRGLEGEQTIIIIHEQEIVTALKINPLNTQRPFDTFTEEEIQDIKQNINEKDYDEIEREEFLLIINQELFYEDEINLIGKQINISEEMLIRIALSETKQELLEVLEEHEEISAQELIIFANQEKQEIKNQIYYALFINKITETKGKFIIDGIKNKQIHTEPKLISITLLNYFPERLMERLFNTQT